MVLREGTSVRLTTLATQASERTAAAESRTVRTAIDRWRIARDLVRQVEAVVQMGAYLDDGEGDARWAHRVAILVTELDAEATRLTVEAAEQYVRAQRDRAWLARRAKMTPRPRPKHRSPR